MFSQTVQLEVRPELREDFLADIAANAEASVRDEPGCLRFDVSAVEGYPNRFMFYELYTDSAAFEAHRTAPHFAVWRAAADRVLVPGSQVNVRGVVLITHTAGGQA